MARNKYTFYQWCLDNERDDLLNRWDYDKTGFGPSDVTYQSNKYIYFKCPKGIHESAKRKLFRITGKNTDQTDFKCVECLNGHAQNFEDLTGMKFGDLTVLKLDELRNNINKKTNNNQTYWICECSCGNIISTYSSALKRGAQVTCGDRTIHRSGENASNWRGGITSELLSQRTSKEYNTWRDATYAKDWYTCQCCGDYGDSMEKNAHHIENFSDNENLRYDLTNSILLCAKCHHIKCKGSFHNIYGTRDNNASQLEDYINNKRIILGIHIPFSIDEYKKGNILRPGDIKRVRSFYENWNFFQYCGTRLFNSNIAINKYFVKIKPKYRVKEE